MSPTQSTATSPLAAQTTWAGQSVITVVAGLVITTEKVFGQHFDEKYISIPPEIGEFGRTFVTFVLCPVSPAVVCGLALHKLH